MIASNMHIISIIKNNENTTKNTENYKTPKHKINIVIATKPQYYRCASRYNVIIAITVVSSVKVKVKKVFFPPLHSGLLNRGVSKVLHNDSTSTQTEAKAHNALMHAANGNIKRYISIVQWNKANSLIRNTIDRIKDIAAEIKPDVIILNEVNLCKTEDDVILNLHGYNVEKDDLGSTYGKVRTVMYISKQFIYKRRRNLEYSHESMITVELGLPNTPKIFISGIYRQHNQIGKPRSFKEQEHRLSEVIKVWKSVISQGKELMIVGDINIHSASYFKNEHQYTDYERQQKKNMILMMKDLLSIGMMLANPGMITRNSLHQKPSSLDQILTNRPDKLTNIRAIFTHMSDHKIIY